jgi:hypothetical protein
MNILSLLTFLPPILTGTLLVHLLWADRKSPFDLIFQFSLGTALGLGLTSLLYYLYLNLFAGKPYFLYLELALFFAVLAAAYVKHKKTVYVSTPVKLGFLQIALLTMAAIISAISFAGIVNYSRQRAHGDWDAWMIYNRSARFIYRGGEAWRDAFSSDMDLVFHADYPPLLALNIASGWETLSAETTSVPMLQGFLFSLAALGLCFGALATLKSPGQGAVGLILLTGVSSFLGEGGRQTADVPLALYILSSIIFLIFYYREKRPILMALAAVMAGLAAWTKNEGLLFVLVSSGILFIAGLWQRSLRDFLFFLAGLILPLILVFHFKTQVAPPSEFANGGISVLLQKMTDPARHKFIFDSFAKLFLTGNGWLGVGILPILAVYFLLFRARTTENFHVILIGLAILACQYLGYYGSYLISPYDLKWHIGYSLGRLFLQAYPAIVFLVLTAVRTPETVFSATLD